MAYPTQASMEITFRPNLPKMKPPKNSPTHLAGIAKDESRFRIRIVASIVEIAVRPDIDYQLRVLIVLGFLCLAAVSFIFAVGVLHAIAHLSGGAAFTPLLYVGSISALVTALILLAFPLMSKASSAENTLRAKDNFDRILDARQARSPRQHKAKI